MHGPARLRSVAARSSFVSQLSGSTPFAARLRVEQHPIRVFDEFQPAPHMIHAEQISTTVQHAADSSQAVSGIASDNARVADDGGRTNAVVTDTIRQVQASSVQILTSTQEQSADVRQVGGSPSRKGQSARCSREPAIAEGQPGYTASLSSRPRMKINAAISSSCRRTAPARDARGLST